MFQPGEEGHHGARFMLDDGLIDPLPDAAFALHIMPNAPHGIFSGRTGALLASSDVLAIKITGKGGHASMPHNTIDPIPVACEIVTGLQTMIARKVNVFDPAVVTIAKISAGTTNNIIPETANLLGTIRTLSACTRAFIRQQVEQVATLIAAAHGAQAEVTVTEGFPVTLCDSRAVHLGEAVVKHVFGDESWQTLDAPIMGAEDFAYVLEKVPGAMFFLGAAHAGDDWSSCCGLHSNRMVLDESVMARGAALHAALAERFLVGGFDSPRGLI
jgi:hippurate hydrolase